MATTKLNRALTDELRELEIQGRAKGPERVICGYLAPEGERGARYALSGETDRFLRMNSNSYLNLSNHPALIAAADEATRSCGVGPGAVRFIDGTWRYHIELEERVATFVGKPAARIFNSAYTANCGLALAINGPKGTRTHWIGDSLNHNSIIRAMRIAGVPSACKSIYAHNDMADLRRCLDEVPDSTDRVIVIFDGIFSMRGDNAPIKEILAITEAFEENFPDGVITVVDDSHGIGAYGASGRGTSEFCGAQPDIIVGTFGKAFGVNGGFIAADAAAIEAVRQKADTYIYTNPLSVADCAAAHKALNICDSIDGQLLLSHLKERTEQFRAGLSALGLESIPGPHPVVPLLVRDTARTRELVQQLFDAGILVVGLAAPVVPQGDETIRFQINCGHTAADIDFVLATLKALLDRQSESPGENEQTGSTSGEDPQ